MRGDGRQSDGIEGAQAFNFETLAYLWIEVRSVFHCQWWLGFDKPYGPSGHFGTIHSGGWREWDGSEVDSGFRDQSCGLRCLR